MKLYEELLMLEKALLDQEARNVVKRAAYALMPSDLRLSRQVSEIAGEVALVSDIVDRLGLPDSMSVRVGRTLSSLGYRKQMIMMNTKVHPAWIRAPEYPKLELHRILQRRSPRAPPVRHCPK